MLPLALPLLREAEPSGAVVIGSHVRPVEELKTAMLRVRAARGAVLWGICMSLWAEGAGGVQCARSWEELEAAMLRVRGAADGAPRGECLLRACGAGVFGVRAQRAACTPGGGLGAAMLRASGAGRGPWGNGPCGDQQRGRA